MVLERRAIYKPEVVVSTFASTETDRRHREGDAASIGRAGRHISECVAVRRPRFIQAIYLLLFVSLSPQHLAGPG
jgi:hypothetical protein